MSTPSSGNSSPYGKRYPLVTGGLRVSSARRERERLKSDLVMSEADERKEKAKSDMFSKREEEKSKVWVYVGLDENIYS
jgi:hypothetical protein